MFGFDQRQRLLRSTWSGPDGAGELSEELFAMFSPDAPNNTQAPMAIDLPQAMRDAGIAPIQIPSSGDTAPIFSIGHPNGDTFTFTINTTDGTVGLRGPKGEVGAQGKKGTNGVPVWG